MTAKTGAHAALLVMMIAGIVLLSHGQAQAKKGPAPKARKGDGLKAARVVKADLCLPATEVEYRALGKTGVLRLEASSMLASELPLERAYLDIDGVEITLPRITHSGKAQEKGSGPKKWKEVSFYLVPLGAVSRAASVMVDFNGQTGFGVTKFDASDDLPAFIRSETDDSPTDPDVAALRKLLRREYPDDFSE